MRIKKAIIREPFIVSSDSVQKEISQSCSFQSSSSNIKYGNQQNKKIRSNKQFRQLNQLFYHNYRVDGSVGMKQGRRHGNSNSDMINRRRQYDDNGFSNNKKDLIEQQRQQIIIGDIQSSKGNNNSNKININIKNSSSAQLKNRCRYDIIGSRELMDEHVNQLIRQSLGNNGRRNNDNKGLNVNMLSSCSSLKNGGSNSNTSPTRHLQKQSSNNQLTLSTIKQKIQRYLYQQQSKLKQQQQNINKNINSNNNRSHINNQQQEQSQLQQHPVTNNNKDNYSTKREGIFSSLTSLTRKKEVKFAYDMMKRRLNFSMINKPVKNRDIGMGMGTSRSNNNKRNENGNNYDNNNHDNHDHHNLNQKRHSLNLNQQAHLRKSYYIKTGGEQIIKMDQRLLQVLQKQPELLDEKQKKVLMSLGYRIADNEEREKQRLMRNRVKTQGGQGIRINSFQSTQNISNIIANEPLLPTISQLTNPYLYNLSYFQSQHNNQTNPVNLSTTDLQYNTNSNYNKYNPNSSSKQRLTMLLLNNSTTTNPLDDVQNYYLGAFVNKNNNDIESISYQKSFHSVLTNSQSKSLSPLHRKKPQQYYCYLKGQQVSQNGNKNNITQNNSTNKGPQSNPLNNAKQQFPATKKTNKNSPSTDKVIFFSKKHKQQSPPNKLSNLLQKIQKRNSQLQRISRLQVIEIFKSQQKLLNNNKRNMNSNQRHKINGLNLVDYVQDEHNVLMKRQLRMQLQMELRLRQQLQQQGFSNMQHQGKGRQRQHYNYSNGNFIVQYPKKQPMNNKQHGKSLTTPGNSPQKKRNKDDWSVFQPWKNPIINQDQYQSYYQQLSTSNQNNTKKE